MDREAAEKALIGLARQSAATWQRVRGQAFRGETIVETTNTLYRFEDGVFSSRAPKPAAGDASSRPAWESPSKMAGLELIGFLADEGGLWSLSPRWQPGALAVLWRVPTCDARTSDGTSDDSFTLTSPTVACRVEREEPELRSPPERSDVFTVPWSRPPTVRRPAPPSMTRLQPAPPPR